MISVVFAAITISIAVSLLGPGPGQLLLLILDTFLANDLSVAGRFQEAQNIILLCRFLGIDSDLVSRAG